MARHAFLSRRIYIWFVSCGPRCSILLFLLVIVLRLDCCMIDALHALDLGLSAHIQGNTLWESMRDHKWGGRSQTSNADKLHSEMKTWFKAQKISSRIQGTITKERIRDTTGSGYPKLKAKGAATRHLAPFSLLVAQRFNQKTDHDNMKVAICEVLCRIYEIFRTSNQFFTEPIKT